MKIIHIYLFILSILFYSCQQEESPDNITHHKLETLWKTSKIETVFNSSQNGYIISKAILEEVSKSVDLTEVRFIPEIVNQQLCIKVLGVISEGNTTQGSLVKPIAAKRIIEQLFLEKQSYFNTALFPKTVAAHILQPNEAIKFISAWQQKYKNNTLEEATSYDGERIKYFSMPATVIRHMVQNNPNGFYLVWGVNPKGKFTTVFLPKVELSQKLFETGGLIYEYSAPCPPTCNPPLDLII